ncbi:ImmA/IrrE family metallo-endopeptidase [Bacillus altitudinis]|uniref:ImmA/IrrE family metallo-endopeptidase n=1 Tax=Bacillus altitudinis TaxID=293387 RepID=UPI00240A2840|nr:ImmA/IrrE family metallo-endopeptidase [Bacillus altitudinis]WEZ69914.1 ImmA/IrrE family metallo-endopeptidase [Bacillus altitudinis]
MQKLIAVAKSRSNEVRNSMGLGDEPIYNIFKLLESEGIFLFKRPFKGKASAMFMKSKDAHLVIINSNKTLGHQIFSAAHELSHYLYDSHIMGGVCAVNKFNQDLEIEKAADLFASHFLMPEEGILKYVIKRTDGGSKNLKYTDIIYLQQHFNVSWSAMLNRVYNLGHISKEEYDFYKSTIKIKTEALRHGYPTEIYEIDDKMYNSQLYIEKAMRAFENDEISEKKLEEFLKDIDMTIDQLSLNEEKSHIIEEEDYA